MTDIMWSDISFYGDAKGSKNWVAIEEAINNIIYTSPEQRLFDPLFGVDLESILFEICDDTTAEQLFDLLINGIEYNDPRFQVDISNSSVVAVPDENTYYISLAIIVAGVESMGTFNFSINTLE